MDDEKRDPELHGLADQVIEGLKAKDAQEGVVIVREWLTKMGVRE